MIKKIFLTGVVLCLAGCSVGPDYTAPSFNFKDLWASSDSKTTQPEAINTKWWTVFNDPLLEKYIARAIENNKDIKIALANVRAVSYTHLTLPTIYSV